MTTVVELVKRNFEVGEEIKSLQSQLKQKDEEIEKVREEERSKRTFSFIKIIKRDNVVLKNRVMNLESELLEVTERSKKKDVALKEARYLIEKYNVFIEFNLESLSPIMLGYLDRSKEWIEKNKGEM